MRILDIDLDFFLDEIAHFRKRNNQRLNKNAYIPWNAGQVECFLENKLGLDKNNPLPGALFIHHDEVFDWCKDLRMNENDESFSFVHVDAHSDLATGIDGCYIYIMETMLRKPIANRPEIKDAGYLQKLNPGNFLVFMAACEWVNEITFVKHHKSNELYNPLFFQDNNIATNNIQLKSYQLNIVKKLAQGTNIINNIRNHNPIFQTTPIPFREVKWCDYNENNKFDYIFLTQSPSFTPRSSDKLIDVIKMYMQIKTTANI
ncbi:MAG: hypothetical protein HGB12_12025 [Bacteroidetes bacterium]|nr:hypothetical protein [Bacteroidota bacterium]